MEPLCFQGSLQDLNDFFFCIEANTARREWSEISVGKECGCLTRVFSRSQRPGLSPCPWGASPGAPGRSQELEPLVPLLSPRLTRDKSLTVRILRHLSTLGQLNLRFFSLFPLCREDFIPYAGSGMPLGTEVCCLLLSPSSGANSAGFTGPAPCPTAASGFPSSGCPGLAKPIFWL